MLRKNCFENLVADVKKNCLSVHTTTFRKKCENLKKNKKKKYEIVYNLWQILGTKVVLLVDF